MKRAFLLGVGFEKDVALRRQLAGANEQIEAFKGMDIEGIQKASDDYKAKLD